MYETFIYQKLQKGELDDYQVNFLLAAQDSEDGIQTALESLDLRQEYQSYCHQNLQTQQDSQYQSSVIEDRIRMLMREIDDRRTTLATHQASIADLQRAYDNFQERLDQFPDNPTLLFRAKEAAGILTNAKGPIIEIEQHILQLEEELTSFQIAKSITE